MPLVGKAIGSAITVLIERCIGHDDMSDVSRPTPPCSARYLTSVASARIRLLELAALVLGLGVTVVSVLLFPLWGKLLALGLVTAALAAVPNLRRLGRALLAIVAAALLASTAIAWVISNRDPPGPSPVAHHRFARSYVGPVWARITPASAHVNETHTIILCWGPLIRSVRLKRLGPASQSLLFEKGKDNTRIQARIKPPAAITFGVGEPPDGNARDINDGWKRGRCRTPTR